MSQLKIYPEESTISVYLRDTVISHSRLRTGTRNTRRYPIREFTPKSIANLLHIMRNTSYIWRTSILLVYDYRNFPSTGVETKRHLDLLLRGLVIKFKGLKYIWKMEFQVNGAPHFHLVVSREFTDEEFDYVVRRWKEITRGGCAVKKEINQVNYEQSLQTLSLYFAKASQCAVPEGFLKIGRFWGANRGLLPNKGQPLVSLQVLSKEPFTEAERLLTPQK